MKVPREATQTVHGRRGNAGFCGHVPFHTAPRPAGISFIDFSGSMCTTHGQHMLHVQSLGSWQKQNKKTYTKFYYYIHCCTTLTLAFIYTKENCTEPINTTPHIFTVDVNFSFPCENCAGFKWPVSCSTNSLLHFITVTRQLICEPLAQSLSRETDTNFFYSTEQSECPAYFKPQTQGLLLDSQRWKINENI